MRLKVLALSLALVAGAVSAENVVGGWSEVPRAELAAEAGPPAKFAVAHLPGRHGRLKAIIGAERQVVAGMNYRMLLALTDGHRWRVQVWKKLDGTMELSSAKRVK